MKSLLTCLSVVLFALDASSGLAANNSNSNNSRTNNPRGRGKEAPAKSIMSNFSNEEAIPDPSDELAASREWKDSTGEHSCQAQLQSVHSGDVTLKKKDGTLTKLSLPKLSKEDQELVHAFLTRNALRQMTKAIQAYRQVDLGETKAKTDEKKKAEDDRLRRKINGRQVRLVFPIKDVGAPDKGISVLTLEAPDIKADGWDFRTNAKMKLSKEEALRTNSSSVLIVEGKAVIASIGEGTKGQRSGRGLENNDYNVMAYDNVQLTLDKPRMSIQHGPPKVGKAKSTPSVSAASGPPVKPDGAAAATVKSDVSRAATATEPLDVFDNEKSVPESSDEIAASRKWRDSKGEHAVTAQLQSVEAGSVALKKGDGKVVNVPFAKLYKDDQELVRSFLMLSSKRKIASAVASFFEAVATSDGHVTVNERVAAEKLYQAVNGRQLRLVFPIKDGTVAEDQIRYKLNVSAPDFPQGGLSWHSQTSSYQSLTREEFAKIGPSSVLIVHGKVRVEFSSNRREEARRNPKRGRRLDNGGGQSGGGGPGGSAVPEDDSILSWESSGAVPGGGNVTRRVRLYLDNSTTTIQHEQPKAKTTV